LPEKTHGHIKSAFCDGMATTVTAAHHFIWRHLYASMQAAQTPASNRFVTADKESSKNTLGQEEELEQICSRESLTEKAAEIDRTISVKEHEKKRRHDFDPKMFYEHRIWNQRPDGIVNNKNHRTLYIVEFKRSSDRNEDFLGVKEDEANEQLKSIIEALKAAAPEFTFERINFVAWRRGAIVEDDFYNKHERLSVQAGKKNKIILASHCNAYANCMTQSLESVSTISKYVGCLGLTQRRRWRTLYL